jgi:hypothetical protein
MQLTPEQQGELAKEANAMTWRLCELVRQHKALLLEICKAPLTASGTRPDTVKVPSLPPSAWALHQTTQLGRHSSVAGSSIAVFIHAGGGPLG